MPAAMAKLRTDDWDHLDIPPLAQERVGVRVAIIRHPHARRQGDEVVAVIPPAG